MPVTKTTRRGNGPGHGGPAKGAGVKLGADPARDRVVQSMGGKVPNGQGKKTVADLLIEAGGREIAAQRWLAILNDPEHPHHASMVEKGARRMDGDPLQTLAGSDGAPLVFNVVTGVPRRAASDD